MQPRIILIPVPTRDFDPTEVALTWHLLQAAGHAVRFATVDGERGYADPVMLTGEGLDPWSGVPALRGLVLLGRFLRAGRSAREAYARLQADPAFLAPLPFARLKAGAFDALVLPGGHARGMRPYLEDPDLQRFVGAFFDLGRPVAAVCHGVVLAARSLSPQTGRSVLHGRRTTALPWSMERAAWRLTRAWAGDYYRTYGEGIGEPAGYRSVEMEVRRGLAEEADFLDVPRGIPRRWVKASGLLRDSPEDRGPAWVVRDGMYLSARWPGDVHTFAARFLELLEERYGGA